MRKYQPIWNSLKENLEANIAAPPEIHARIIQAVKKERWRDAGWKYLLLEKGIKYKLAHTSTGSILSFSLIEIQLIRTDTL
jgi:hypothetical protein